MAMSFDKYRKRVDYWNSLGVTFRSEFLESEGDIVLFAHYVGAALVPAVIIEYGEPLTLVVVGETETEYAYRGNLDEQVLGRSWYPLRPRIPAET